MDRLEELIARYLDAVLSPTEARELADRLRADRKAVRTFLAFYQEDRLLTELHRPATDEAVAAIMTEMAHAEQAFVGTVMQRVRTELPREVPTPFARIAEWFRWLRRPGVAFAGGALVLTGLAVFFFGATVGEPTLALNGSAQATLERGGQVIAVADGLKLRTDDVLSIIGTNAVAITYGPENTRVELLPGTTLRLLTWKQGKQFDLRQGKIEASVARQRPFTPMVVRTPQAEARVLGTKFTLAATTNATRLGVTHGKVRFTRASDGARVDVPAEHYAIAAANVSLAALPRTDGILREYWTNLPGRFVRDMEKDRRYPNQPDGRDSLKNFEAPPDWGDNYGARIRGYVHPPVTGDYTFWTAGNTEFFLYVSPDDDLAGAVCVCYGGSMRPRDFDQPQTNEKARKSNPIRMAAGRRYYVEALLKAGVGEDHLAVAWSTPGREREIIPGEYLSPFKPKK